MVILMIKIVVMVKIMMRLEIMASSQKDPLSEYYEELTFDGVGLLMVISMAGGRESWRWMGARY